MNDTELKDIMNRDKKWLEAFYNLLWEGLGVALACAIFWLMYICLV